MDIFIYRNNIFYKFWYPQNYVCGDRNMARLWTINLRLWTSNYQSFAHYRISLMLGWWRCGARSRRCARKTSRGSITGQAWSPNLLLCRRGPCYAGALLSVSCENPLYYVILFPLPIFVTGGCPPPPSTETANYLTSVPRWNRLPIYTGHPTAHMWFL